MKLQFVVEFEEHEHSQAKGYIDGLKWQSVCWDLDQWLRGQIKYSMAPEQELARLQGARDKLRELMTEEGVEFE